VNTTTPASGWKTAQPDPKHRLLVTNPDVAKSQKRSQLAVGPQFTKIEPNDSNARTILDPPGTAAHPLSPGSSLAQAERVIPPENSSRITALLCHVGNRPCLDL
jgi:hypothetical protein